MIKSAGEFNVRSGIFKIAAVMLHCVTRAAKLRLRQIGAVIICFNNSKNV